MDTQSQTEMRIASAKGHLEQAVENMSLGTEAGKLDKDDELIFRAVAAHYLDRAPGRLNAEKLEQATRIACRDDVDGTFDEAVAERKEMQQQGAIVPVIPVLMHAQVDHSGPKSTIALGYTRIMCGEDGEGSFKGCAFLRFAIFEYDEESDEISRVT